MVYYLFQSALYVSGDIFAHPQEHLSVSTALVQRTDVPAGL